MFRRILIANRGEVAARVLRTCSRMGIETVAVASAADRGSAWLAEATHTVTIGAPRSAASYLDQDALIEVALHHKCAAVHPGWGFLAENAEFCARVTAAGLTFVGPEPRHLRQMGDKAEARRTMGSLGMPLIPGSAPLGSVDEALREAARVGYPALLKAVAGGGGRGMRGVSAPEELPAAFAEASAEAVSAFGDGRMYLERRIVGGRHVEVQVVADRFGRCLALGERECSLQRRHQKVLEEAPSPGLSAAERARILPLVADAVGRSGYRNAGTVEMLLDADGRMYFMEMNTRLQVEHPVTEVTSGVDLVEWQLRVAAGERLPAEAPPRTGHAIECRINAEDPDNGFRPSPGTLRVLSFPEGEGIRVDTHLRGGDTIPPYYDSMIAKLIVWAPTRPEAIARMAAALDAVRIEGVITNLSLHQRIVRWDAFLDGQFDTTSLENLVGRS
ncbi:MAG: biotin carboxylase N-terminal domain-containing protein [Myxococcota bacterium]